MFKIIFTDTAIKDLECLDKEVKLRIAYKVKEYSKDPFKYARKLINSKIGGYRFRIGD
jgi:mRNA interferase RelE/StbE